MEYRRFLMKAGRWDEAEAMLARAVALNPDGLSYDREIAPCAPPAPMRRARRWCVP